jgi:hypothetical protein
MKRELQKQLFDKYPQLFTQKDLPPTQSNMCFGFECGDGWFTLLDNLCKIIYDDRGYSYDVTVTQVKEKFGGLRFYYTGGNDFISGAVMLAEKMSEHICEECGDKGSINYDAGWLRCRCEKHKEE